MKIRLNQTLIKVLVILVGYLFGRIAYCSNTFEDRYKLRIVSDRLGTLCDGYLNGSYLVALKDGKLFGIKVVEHIDWVSYMESYSLDDIGFVHFKNGEVFFVSVTTGEKIRVKLSELEGVLR